MDNESVRMYLEELLMPLANRAYDDEARHEAGFALARRALVFGAVRRLQGMAVVHSRLAWAHTSASSRPKRGP